MIMRWEAALWNLFGLIFPVRNPSIEEIFVPSQTRLQPVRLRDVSPISGVKHPEQSCGFTFLRSNVFDIYSKIQ